MLKPIQPYIEYLVNQDYITEFLCINKEKPKLQCNGKCYLVKALKKQQSSTSKSLRVSLENYPIGFVTIFQIRTNNTVNLTKKNIPEFYEKLYHTHYNSNTFVPPDLV